MPIIKQGVIITFCSADDCIEVLQAVVGIQGIPLLSWENTPLPDIERQVRNYFSGMSPQDSSLSMLLHQTAAKFQGGDVSYIRSKTGATVRSAEEYLREIHYNDH